MSGHNVNVCDIGDDVKEVIKKFRFQKHTSNSALILKVHIIFAYFLQEHHIPKINYSPEKITKKPRPLLGS